jgi:hypothetical protein
MPPVLSFADSVKKFGGEISPVGPADCFDVSVNSNLFEIGHSFKWFKYITAEVRAKIHNSDRTVTKRYAQFEILEMLNPLYQMHVRPPMPTV